MEMSIPAVMRTDEHHIEKHNKFLSLHEKQDIEALFIGDSLVRRWEDNIDLWNRYFEKFGPENFGVGGDRIENVKWRLLNHELDGMSPRVVVILIGTNNLATDGNERIVSGIQELIGIIREQLAETRILLLGLLPREGDREGAGYNERIRKINVELSRYCVEKGHIFLDLGTYVVTENGEIDSAIMPDGLHLNREGYNRIGPYLEQAIAELT